LPATFVILSTPPTFRWVQFTYAVEKGLNTFMEKPISVDGPTTRRMMKLGEAASQKNLKVDISYTRSCDISGRKPRARYVCIPSSFLFS